MGDGVLTGSHPPNAAIMAPASDDWRPSPSPSLGLTLSNAENAAFEPSGEPDLLPDLLPVLSVLTPSRLLRSVPLSDVPSGDVSPDLPPLPCPISGDTGGEGPPPERGGVRSPVLPRRVCVGLLFLLESPSFASLDIRPALGGLAGSRVLGDRGLPSGDSWPLPVGSPKS